MPKTKKRKRTAENVQALKDSFHLTGLDIDQQGESLLACMAEFEDKTAAKEASTTNDESSANAAGGESLRQVDTDQTETWNRSLLAWLHSGNYLPAGLLPSIDEEVARHFQVQELSKFLLSHGNDLRMPVFERWLLDSRLEDETSRDPILPMSLNASMSPACDRLVEELENNGISTGSAITIVEDLARKANVAGQEIAAKKDSYEKTSPLKKGDRMEVEDHDQKLTLAYSRKKWKKPFCFSLNKEHYDKLKTLFYDVHNRDTKTKLSEDSKKIDRVFNILVIALLLRYSSMSGGQLLQDLRGGGMQGSVHGNLFEVLKETFGGIWIEGFASPFNAHLPIFGSAFSNLDWHFGSIGTFMETSLARKEGLRCEANPPFSPGVMLRMVEHIESQLNLADRIGSPLTFAIVVPTAGSKKDGVVQKAANESFRRMVCSEFCSIHIHLKAREHGYVEGAQHLRATRYKQSSYDTSVIILQSKRDRIQVFEKKVFEMKVRSAFASRHEQELIQRRGDSIDD